jgi:predicted ATP-grasp superfamily ATP-dependent carboligase
MSDSKLYYAKDLTVWKSPVREKVEGGERLTVGFPVCTVSEYVGEEGAEAVAALLALGEAAQNEASKPLAARDLLEAIDRKAEAGLCYFTLGSARAFLQDIRDLVAPHISETADKKDSTHV